jgi:ankyrin repeat protein
LPIAPFERAANALERSEAVLHSPRLKLLLARYYHYASPQSPRLLKPDFILLWLVLGFLLLNAISYAGSRSIFPKALDEYMLRTNASYTNTSFHAAIAKGRADRLEHLLGAGHVTSLDWKLLREALDAGEYASADKLIQYGVKPTEPRLLLDAVYEKRLDFVKLILDHGADPNGKGIAGRTALHEASKYGLTSFVKELIARGAQVNAVDDKGVTPVMEAVQGTALGWNDNPIETLKLLYANGASLKVKNQENKSAYDLAKSGYSSISTSDKVKGKLDTVMRFLLVPESVR